MAHIQWFPGHMAKAKREAIEKLKLVDVVIEILDARIPESSRNPLVDEIKGAKKSLLILNKTDLADKKETQAWISYFQNQGHEVLTTQAKDGVGMNQVKAALKRMMEPDFEKNRARGIVKQRPIRLMVLGIPNVGKSTFINRMIQKNQAETANRPGVTKGQRWLKINDEFELLDTPGILWPKFEDQEIGNRLAITGAIKDTLLHMDDLALEAIKLFTRLYPGRLEETYQLPQDLTPVDLLMALTQKFGYKEDYDKASIKLIQDIRSGRLGTYSLDLAPRSLEDLKHD